MTLDKNIIIGIGIAVSVDVGRKQLLFAKLNGLHTNALYKNIIVSVDGLVKINVASPKTLIRLHRNRCIHFISRVVGVNSVGEIFFISAVKRIEIGVKVSESHALFLCHLACGIGINGNDTVRAAVGFKRLRFMSGKILLVNHGCGDIHNDPRADPLAFVDKIRHIRLVGIKRHASRHIQRAIVCAEAYENNIRLSVQNRTLKAHLRGVGRIAADAGVDNVDAVFLFDILLPFICGGDAVAEGNDDQIFFVGSNRKRKT